MTITNSDTIKVVHRGLREGGEEWTTGHWCQVGPEGAMTQAALDEITSEVVSAFSTPWLLSIVPAASASTDWNSTTVLYYPAGAAASTLVSEQAVTAPAGSSSTRHPYECCAVASLRTAIPTRSGRGRMYLPCDAIPVVPGGQYSNEPITQIADGMDTYFTGVNAITAGPVLAVAVAVASHTQSLARPVLQVVVDTLPDTQRRRGNRLLANARQVRAIS